MKTRLLIAALVTLGVQGVAHASFPTDAEAVYSMTELESVQAWGVSKRAVQPHEPFPFGGGYISD
jgi:hypothetical protein